MSVYQAADSLISAARFIAYCSVAYGSYMAYSGNWLGVVPVAIGSYTLGFSGMARDLVIPWSRRLSNGG